MAEPGVADLRARLARRLADFARFLRAHGLAVGPGAEGDLARALEVVDPLDRADFANACVVVLARSPEEVGFVRAAVEAFFSPAGDRPVPAPHPELPMLPPRPRPAHRPGRRPPPVSEPPDPVVAAVPVGTYSDTAPATRHPIAPLSEREIRALAHGARRFGRTVASRPGRRRARARHGPIDLRDTMRRSLQQSGEWFELRRQRPRASRAELVVLWDVSGSMREHESRLFGLIHVLARTARHARVFAFSTEVEEITDALRQGRYARVADRVGRRVDRADGGTRIGGSLHEFAERFGGTLRDTTTLVVLSDGWDLGESAAVGAELGRLAARVHRTVWLTPYTRRPGFEPRVGALESALSRIDALVGPEDFESRRALRPFPLSGRRGR